jgi:integrase
MTVLKHMLRRAASWNYLSRNPFLDAQGRPLGGLRPLREPSGRVRFLTPDEMDRLLVACDPNPYLKAFAIVAMNTGMRRNEILGLTRKAIDWWNRVATLPDTKNGETGYVPLNDAAIASLKSLSAVSDSDRLFPFKPNQVSVAMKRAIRRARIEDFRLHDLRHTFASYQTMNATPTRAIQALLRHKDGRMTARYSHLSDRYLKAAVDGVVLGSVMVKSMAVADTVEAAIQPLRVEAKAGPARVPVNDKIG